MLSDKPKTLGDKNEIENRLELLHEKHMEDLYKFVIEIREKEKKNCEIPFFDPLDGGINSTCLFLLEAPGPNAVKSCFISRNNPDETAKNMFEILKELGVPRNKTVLWNIVPWYIGNGEKIRPANSTDIEQGIIYLFRLVSLLSNLKVIVLVGKKAQKIHNKLSIRYPSIRIVESYHPSPLFINNKEKNWNTLKEQLQEVLRYI